MIRALYTVWRLTPLVNPTFIQRAFIYCDKKIRKYFFLLESMCAKMIGTPTIPIQINAIEAFFVISSLVDQSKQERFICD